MTKSKFGVHYMTANEGAELKWFSTLKNTREFLDDFTDNTVLEIIEKLPNGREKKLVSGPVIKMKQKLKEYESRTRV